MQRQAHSPRRAYRIAAASLLLAAAILLGWNVYYRSMVSPAARSDFLVFHAAGRAVLEGRDPYDVAHPRGWPFLYPPAMAVAMVPLALLPAGVAVVVWYAISLLALVWSARRLRQLLAPQVPRTAASIALLAMLVNAAPIVSCLQRGQISLLLFALTMEAVWRARGERAGAAGLLIAVGASLKLQPALLLLAPAIQLRWRILPGFIAGCFAFLAVLPAVSLGPQRAMELSRSWFDAVLLPAMRGQEVARVSTRSTVNVYSPSNQSLLGGLGRWLARGRIARGDVNLAIADLPPAKIRRWAVALALGLLAAITFCMWRARRAGGWRFLAVWALPVLAANYVTEIGWHHYYVVLAFPLAVAAAGVQLERARGLRGVLAGGIFAAVLGNWLHSSSHTLRAAGVMLCGALLLTAALAVGLLGGRREEASDCGGAPTGVRS